MPYATRKIKATSERGRMMAKRRWELDRARRDILAATDPVKFEGKIIRRIVVIDLERKAREIAIYDFDSAREARRKERKILSKQL